jgi:hypothetical protein
MVVSLQIGTAASYYSADYYHGGERKRARVGLHDHRNLASWMAARSTSNNFISCTLGSLPMAKHCS